MANTLYYIDPSAAVNGTGSILNPFNTTAGLPTEQSKTYLLRAGTVINEDLGPLLNGDNNIIGAYGTGQKPVVNRTAALTGLVYNPTYDLWEKVIGSAGFGYVTEDGAFLKAVYWGAANTLAAVAALMTPGSFAFDWVSQTVYVKPTAGSATGHTYRYSAGLYCIRSSNQNKNLAIQDIDIVGASRHGTQLYNKIGLKIKNVGGGGHGGYWESSRNAYLGNGIEVSAGCLGVEVEDCEQNDVWDSPFTTQVYESAAATARYHEYRNIRAKRFGLTGVEISLPGTDANQSIRDIYVTSAVLEDGGPGLWMNKPAGSANSIVSTLSSGLTNSISGVVFSDIKGKNAGRLWSTANTQGRCVLTNSVGDGMTQYGLRKVYAGGGLIQSTDIITADVKLLNSAVNSEAGGTFTFRNSFRQVKTYI